MWESNKWLEKEKQSQTKSVCKIENMIKLVFSYNLLIDLGHSIN